MRIGMAPDVRDNLFIGRNFWYFVGFLALIFSFSLIYSFYSFVRIITLSNIVAEDVLPRARGTQEATSSMLNSRFVFGELLGLIEPSDLELVRSLEAEMAGSILILDSYLAAFTWGSESTAFKKSDGGLNYAEWRRLGLAKSLVIQTPTGRQRQLAGAVDIYFGGFSINALKAAGNHKKFLRLKKEGLADAAEIVQKLSLKQAAEARGYFKLASDTLSLMARESNALAAENVNTIARTQRNALISILIVILLGFLAAATVTLKYANRIRGLLVEADTAAKLLVRNSRELTFTNQQLVDRNREFNEMIKVLIGRDLDLSHANKELMDLDELKTRFVSTAAHELRTPLTALKWSLNELADGEVGKLRIDQKKAVEDMVAANNRLIKLVNELLDLSRLGEGRELFEFKKQDIIPILKEVCGRYQKLADEKGVKLIIETPSAAPAIMFDAEKMKIAFSNLVDNAIKYTSPGGEAYVRFYVKNGGVAVEVSDTGIGIPESETNHVFNRFFRASNAVLMEAYGTGLGLAVAKEIIEKHNGSVTFNSSEGKGSVFTINLPLI